MTRAADNRIEEIVDLIINDYEDDRTVNRVDILNQPDKKAIVDVLEKLLKILYPGYYSDKVYKIYSLRNNMAATIEDVIFHLKKQIVTVLRYNRDDQSVDADQAEDKATVITYEFMKKIPAIRSILETDIDAAYEGDPAADSKDEIILSYPGLFAISVYRIAHELHLLNVPMIPRIMTEYAHSVTGIDAFPHVEDR